MAHRTGHDCPGRPCTFQIDTSSLGFRGCGSDGAAFPLLCHAAIGPTRDAGKKLSYLYLSNIIRSALGSFIVGFVALDHLSTQAVSILLLGLSILVATVLAVLARPIKLKSVYAVCCGVWLVLFLLSGPLYSHLYERLLFKGAYNSSMQFSERIENRNGVTTVFPSRADLPPHDQHCFRRRRL